MELDKIYCSDCVPFMASLPENYIDLTVTSPPYALGPNALKMAYATIPDLRPTQMYFGLSVDLSWKTGADFDIVIGPATNGN